MKLYRIFLIIIIALFFKICFCQSNENRPDNIKKFTLRFIGDNEDYIKNVTILTPNYISWCEEADSGLCNLFVLNNSSIDSSIGIYSYNPLYSPLFYNISLHSNSVIPIKMKFYIPPPLDFYNSHTIEGSVIDQDGPVSGVQIFNNKTPKSLFTNDVIFRYNYFDRDPDRITKLIFNKEKYYTKCVNIEKYTYDAIDNLNNIYLKKMEPINLELDFFLSNSLNEPIDEVLISTNLSPDIYVSDSAGIIHKEIKIFNIINSIDVALKHSDYVDTNIIYPFETLRIKDTVMLRKQWKLLKFYVVEDEKKITFDSLVVHSNNKSYIAMAEGNYHYFLAQPEDNQLFSVVLPWYKTALKGNFRYQEQSDEPNYVICEGKKYEMEIDAVDNEEVPVKINKIKYRLFSNPVIHEKDVSNNKVLLDNLNLNGIDTAEIVCLPSNENYKRYYISETIQVFNKETPAEINKSVKFKEWPKDTWLDLQLVPKDAELIDPLWIAGDIENRPIIRVPAGKFKGVLRIPGYDDIPIDYEAKEDIIKEISWDYIQQFRRFGAVKFNISPEIPVDYIHIAIYGDDNSLIDSKYVENYDSIYEFHNIPQGEFTIRATAEDFAELVHTDYVYTEEKDLEPLLLKLKRTDKFFVFYEDIFGDSLLVYVEPTRFIERTPIIYKTIFKDEPMLIKDIPVGENRIKVLAFKDRIGDTLGNIKANDRSTFELTANYLRRKPVKEQPTRLFSAILPNRDTSRTSFYISPSLHYYFGSVGKNNIDNGVLADFSFYMLTNINLDLIINLKTLTTANLVNYSAGLRWHIPINSNKFKTSLLLQYELDDRETRYTQPGPSYSLGGIVEYKRSEFIGYSLNGGYRSEILYYEEADSTVPGFYNIDPGILINLPWKHPFSVMLSSPFYLPTKESDYDFTWAPKLDVLYSPSPKYSIFASSEIITIGDQAPIPHGKKYFNLKAGFVFRLNSTEKPTSTRMQKNRFGN